MDKIILDEEKNIEGDNVNDIYHYTTLETLLNIVKNKTIRLTDFRFLNDRNEIVDNIKSIQKILRTKEGSEVLNKKLESVFETLMRIGDRKRVYRTNFIDGEEKGWVDCEQDDVNHYILSLTHCADNMLMWSMYGKEGCCIKFNKAKLLEFVQSFENLPLPKSHTYFVEYEREKNKIFVGDINYASITIEKCKSAFEEIVKNTQREIYFYAYDILYSLACFHKKKDFNGECEYRISIPIADEDIENNVFMEKTFLIKDDYFKPQLELKNFPVEEIIEDIILSPYNTSDCSVNSVKVLLSHYLKKDIEVQRSKINIRK